MDEKTTCSGCPEEANGQEKLKFPRVISLIIVIEFCERFSYFALKAILVLFLTDKLLLSEDASTIVFHAFNMASFTFPFLGAFIADSYLGKFRTILYLSLVYTVGCAVLAASSWRSLGLPGLPTACAGLLLIALGTGGIKPCVAAFGGDQFELPQQQHQLQRYFSVFYFVISAGYTLAVLVTPMIRHTPCLSETTCYPLAFGTPALFMLCVCCIFVSGKRYYRMKTPEKNVVIEIIKCMWTALWTRREPGAGGHWLDAAAARCGEGRVADAKLLMRLTLIALPLPMYWALFDMLGSRWTFQARQLDGRLGGWTVLPEQVSLSNALLMMAALPPMEAWLHPWLQRRNLATPLQRVGVGGFMAAAAYAVAGALQLFIDSAAPSKVSVLWQLPQHCLMAAGEIWFAIGVIEFAYREAPANLKSSIIAVFLSTTSAGDLIVIIITSLDMFPNRAVEFFTYAGLMVLVMCGFVFLARRYVPAARHADADGGDARPEADRQPAGKGSAPETGTWSGR